MATDGTELTFVRCSNCKSLVPAISAKCRMCGASLGEDEDIEAKEKSKPSKRVRQKTVSTKSIEATSDITNELKKIQEAIESEKDNTSNSDDIEEELLADELEQLREDELSDQQEEEALDEGILDEEIEEDYDPLSEYIDQLGLNEEDDDEDNKEIELKEDFEEDIIEEDQKINLDEAKKDNGYNKKSPPSKVIIERGKYKGESKLSFTQEKEKKEQRSKPKQNKPKIKEPIKKDTDNNQGELAGWLVSFDDPKGKSIEIRTGKFFITKNKLKDRDFIIDDDSISTPHALVEISKDDGMEVQDLMSDTGVYIKNDKDSEWEAISKSAYIYDKTWIKFGDVEFFVSLII